jgi:predicted RNA binding protein YcfA (HicA-like mRNA interferase family)
MLSNRDQRTLDSIRRGAIVSFRDLIHLIETVGFVLVRQRGSHHVYKHPRVGGALVLQPKGSEAKKYQAHQVLDVLVSNRLVDATT